jgi:hypothetical protein
MISYQEPLAGVPHPNLHVGALPLHANGWRLHEKFFVDFNASHGGNDPFSDSKLTSLTIPINVYCKTYGDTTYDGLDIMPNPRDVDIEMVKAES